MSDVVSKDDFTIALTEGFPVPHLRDQSDIDAFCERIITFFTETPNDFWIDHDQEANDALALPNGSILTIDFGSTPTLRVHVLPGVVKFTLTEATLADVDNQQAVGQAAMGVILFCSLETGKLEIADLADDEEENPVLYEQLLAEELEERDERRRALKEDVNPKPPRSEVKSYVLGGNKKFDFDWL